jgi:methyl-accepting chemotaxis protein
LSAVLCFVGIGIGIASYQTANPAWRRSQRSTLQASAEIARMTRSSAIWRRSSVTLHTVATNPVTADSAFNGLRAPGTIIDRPTETLQAAYIDGQPSSGRAKSTCSMRHRRARFMIRMHATYHPWFRDLQQTNGYYDVFLFDTDGNLVYSVFKELDYATNFATPDRRPVG